MIWDQYTTLGLFLYTSNEQSEMNKSETIKNKKEYH